MHIVVKITTDLTGFVLLSLLIFKSLHVVGMVIPNRKINNNFSNSSVTTKDNKTALGKSSEPTQTAFQIQESPEISQAKLYNSLDSKLITHEDNNRTKFKNASLLFIDDEDDSDEDDLRPGVLKFDEEFHSNTPSTNMTLWDGSNKSDKNFEDAFHTVTESNPVSESESEDQSSRSRSFSRSNFTYESSTNSNRISSWEWTQVKRQKGGHRPFSFLTKPIRRERRSTWDVNAKKICETVEPEESLNETRRPLKCFQCNSNTGEKEPQCDHRYFKYLRHSEKFEMRKRCPQSKGDYCMKIVKRKFGERITERSCFAGPIERPEGKQCSAKSKDGCCTYPGDGYVITTCFCSKDLCNSATRFGPGGAGSLFSVIALCIAFCMYGITFALVDK